MGNRILVTGSTGFVGRQLCRALVEAGHDVIGIGRSACEQGSFEGIDYLQLDLEEGELSQAFVGDIDSVVHLAAQAHGRGGKGNQQRDAFRKANVDVAVKLARLAIDAGVRRFVFVSSIGVHGAVTYGDAISESSPFNPTSPYAHSKLEAELELTRIFGLSQSSELTIVRPPLVYGVSAPGNFGSLLRIAHSPAPLPFGLCSNRRNMISLNGLVEFLALCIRHPGAANQSFVVADTMPVSTSEIVASLRTGMERAKRLVPIPPSIMGFALEVLGKRDMYIQLFGDLEIDNRRAQHVVGWTPCENTLRELEQIGKHFVGSLK